MSEGTDAITELGRGDGKGTSRSLVNSKRKWVRAPNQVALRRQFYSTTPHVIARRRDVAILWEDGATPLDILKLINDSIEIKRADAERLGQETHKLQPVTMATIRNDLKLIRRQAREDAEYASKTASARIINHVSDSLTWARRLYREAADFDERAKALQVGDNVLRTFAKVMGGVPDLSIDIRKTEVKADVTFDGAPAAVRAMREERRVIDATAEYEDNEVD